jgi:hypothetical protein
VTGVTPENVGSANKISDIELTRESSDERDHDAAEQEWEREQWMRENIPPHHL